MREDDRQRKAYGKAWEAGLRPAMKGKGWRKYWSSISRRDGLWFICAECVLLWPTRRLQFLLQAKPMTLDPLLWEIIGAQGNDTQPLSFRKWGTFTCEPPIFAEKIVECGAPEQMAVDFVQFATSERSSILHELPLKPFSTILETMAAKDSVGMLSTTRVLSLLDEEKYDDAISFLTGNFAKGVSINVARPDAQGRMRSTSFFDLAHDYALSQKGRALALDEAAAPYLI
ncbi:hypothetical protein EB232_16645 [Mesorhizobium sp. NZP2077]|nr:hypothetical protein EB232_16645 [Mesorhizobium sp. NZP2077]